MEFTKYEKARIIGARALQIAMNAPVLTNRENELNPIEIAKKEFKENNLPLSVRRIAPEKIERKQPETEITEETKGKKEKESGEENKDTKD